MYSGIAHLEPPSNSLMTTENTVNVKWICDAKIPCDYLIPIFNVNNMKGNLEVFYQNNLSIGNPNK